MEVADAIFFNEGKDWLLEQALDGSETVHVLVSTDAVPADVNSPQAGEHAVTDTLAGGVAEATAGDWGGRETSGLAAPAAGVVELDDALLWNTGEFTDGPSAAKSVVVATSADNSGVAILAMSLGGTRNLSRTNAELSIPALVAFLANPDEGTP